MRKSFQHSIKYPITISGVGIHSGKVTKMTFQPGEINSGIVFRRIDLKENNIIKADFRNVSETTLGTTISNEMGVKVATIEHLMAGIWCAGIDNLIIDIDNIEVPILDGSSMPFVFALESGIVERQDGYRSFLRIEKGVEYVDGEIRCAFLPCDDFEIDLEIEFKSKAIGKQSFVFNSAKDCFYTLISKARTFGHLDEVEYMQSRGLALGGNLENAIVVDNEKVINPEGLRTNNEFVKHKILDAIGDLYLCGKPVMGKFVGSRSGHESNNKLLRKVFANDSNYTII